MITLLLLYDINIIFVNCNYYTISDFILFKLFWKYYFRRTDGSSREEQLIQKEQILAELQRVERELQEKAHAQMMLSSGGENADQIRATEMLEDMVHMSLNSAAASTATG